MNPSDLTERSARSATREALNSEASVIDYFENESQNVADYMVEEDFVEEDSDPPTNGPEGGTIYSSPPPSQDSDPDVPRVEKQGGTFRDRLNWTHQPEVVVRGSRDKIHSRYEAYLGELLLRLKVEDIQDRVEDSIFVLCSDLGTKLVAQGLLDGETNQNMTAGFMIVVFLRALHYVWDGETEYHGDPNEEFGPIAKYASAMFNYAATIYQQYVSAHADYNVLLDWTIFWDDEMHKLFSGGYGQQFSWVGLVDIRVLKPIPNATAKGYLDALSKDPVELAERIMANDASHSWLPHDSALEAAVKHAIVLMLADIPRPILRSIIVGQLMRIKKGQANQELRDNATDDKEEQRPSIYVHSLVDGMGFGPTAQQWERVCNYLAAYLKEGDYADDIADDIDAAVHPRFTRKFSRRFLGDSSSRQGVIEEFIEGMRGRISRAAAVNGLLLPFSAACAEVGYATSPAVRLEQHRRYQSSNYLMNLVESTFEYLYPGCYRAQARVVFNCTNILHCWIGEIVITLLAQATEVSGGGFSHYRPGLSNSGGVKLDEQAWARCLDRAINRGLFDRIEEGRQRTLATRERRLERLKEQNKPFNELLGHIGDVLERFNHMLLEELVEHIIADQDRKAAMGDE